MNPQSVHSFSQGVGVDSEELGRALRPAYLSFCKVQHPLNVKGVKLIQVEDPGCLLRNLPCFVFILPCFFPVLKGEKTSPVMNASALSHAFLFLHLFSSQDLPYQKGLKFADPINLFEG